jgi:hypothetical protein
VAPQDWLKPRPRDEIHLADDPLALGLEQVRCFALNALGGAGGVRHQLGQLIEQPVVGLGHDNSSARHWRLFGVLLARHDGRRGPFLSNFVGTVRLRPS